MLRWVSRKAANGARRAVRALPRSLQVFIMTDAAKTLGLSLVAVPRGGETTATVVWSRAVTNVVIANTDCGMRSYGGAMITTLGSGGDGHAVERCFFMD